MVWCVEDGVCGGCDRYVTAFLQVLMVVVVVLVVTREVAGQNRRPTISFITQPEIVADIGGDVSSGVVVGVTMVWWWL